MAPDRGFHDLVTDDPQPGHSDRRSQSASSSPSAGQPSQSSEGPRVCSNAKDHAMRGSSGKSFTFRAMIVGLFVGILICFSNMFFGLQSGWVSGMTMPASLMGFAFFKAVGNHLNFPFTAVENVLVQTVAGAVGTMPLGSGFVGVVPALETLLTPTENGPLKLSLGSLVVWSLGLSFFGVIFGVPLRKEVIIREKLKFPSGTATALMIGVLHGDEDDTRVSRKSGSGRSGSRSAEVASDERRLVAAEEIERESLTTEIMEQHRGRDTDTVLQGGNIWRFRVRLLAISFVASGLYVGSVYRIAPHLHYLSIPADKTRRSLHTLSLNYDIFRFLVHASRTIGYGPLICRPPIWHKVSSWAKQPRSICSLAPSLDGQYCHLWQR